MINKKKYLLCILLLLLSVAACKPAEKPLRKDTRLKVVATIFPVYDFARHIGGDKIVVSMLLPPATDAHHYELKPEDIVRVSKADIFLFTSFDMEQWAYKVISAAAEKTNMLAVETGQGAMLLPLSKAEEHGHDDKAEFPSQEAESKHAVKYDPHIWLDFTNAQKMIDNIVTALINKDPKNAEFYKKNAEEYKSRMMELDHRYQTQLSRCKKRMILHAGHWAFGYLANRYHLKYLSAYNMSADAEPSPQQIMTLIEQVKVNKLKYLYYEDLVAPKLASTIAEETGAGLIKLSNGHDISKKDIRAGETFVTLMEKNLENFKKGMQCP